ncbi:MAG: hypothetical protein AAFV07_03490, partial [Bacteroidota bacterium]
DIKAFRIFGTEYPRFGRAMQGLTYNLDRLTLSTVNQLAAPESGKSGASRRSPKLNISTVKGADIQASYRYVFPWFRRAASNRRTITHKGPISKDYQLYPYLKPLRWRISVGLGRIDKGSFTALSNSLFSIGQGMRISGFDREWVGLSEGGRRGQHVQVQGAYSFANRLSLSTWIAPHIALRDRGAFSEGIDEGVLSFYGQAQIIQRMGGIGISISPIREDRRWLHRWIPRAEIGGWGSHVSYTQRASAIVKVMGERLSDEATETGSFWRTGYYGKLSLDWCLSRYIFLTGQWTAYGYFERFLPGSSSSLSIPEVDVSRSISYPEIPLQAGNVSVGIGVRI